MKKLLHTVLFRKEGPFEDQDSVFIWNMPNLHANHNSIQANLLLVEKKHRKNACRSQGLKMSLGNYLPKNQKSSHEYALKTTKTQAEKRFKKEVASNIKYLSESKENKSKGTVTGCRDINVTPNLLKVFSDIYGVGK